MVTSTLLTRVAVLAALIAFAFPNAACSSKKTTSAAAPTATSRPATVATTAPTTAPPTVAPSPTVAAFSPAKLPPALMGGDRVTALIAAGYQTLRDKVTDPALPFSSAPNIGPTLTMQNVSLLYSSFQSGAAPAAGRPFAVQNTVQGYPAAGNATAAFAALRTTWQGNLFQNLVQQQPLAGAWQESFCQLGNFTTTGGQAQQWFVCMARLGPYIVTMSIGGFPGLDANAVAAVVRPYFDDALRALQ